MIGEEQNMEKEVLKVVKLDNGCKCYIIKKRFSDDECYQEEVSYVYKDIDYVFFKITISLYSSESVDADYTVYIEEPNEQVLLENCSDESDALSLFNEKAAKNERVPRLSANLSLR